jgi:hypothetical protein
MKEAHHEQHDLGKDGDPLDSFHRSQPGNHAAPFMQRFIWD